MRSVLLAVAATIAIIAPAAAQTDPKAFAKAASLSNITLSQLATDTLVTSANGDPVLLVAAKIRSDHAAQSQALMDAAKADGAIPFGRATTADLSPEVQAVRAQMRTAGADRKALFVATAKTELAKSIAAYDDYAANGTGDALKAYAARMSATEKAELDALNAL